MVDLTRLRDEWDIRVSILFSLELQAILILSGPLRKRTGNKFVTVPLWFAYLTADWAAVFALGLISKGHGTHKPYGAFSNPEILTFWAPFLLVHLGGPDTITAFALEDNELWKRHTLQLISHSALVGYVFVLTLTKLEKNLLAATVLIIVAGLIKYIERTYSLFLASASRFRKSLLTEPDPGPNYAKLMDEYFSKKEANLPTRIEMIPEPQKVTRHVAAVKKEDMKDLEVVKQAYRFSETFRGLIADIIFSFRERNQSRDFFLNRTPKDAFKLVEVELNFFYDILYTKAVVIRGWLGCVLRPVSFSCIVVALVLFYKMDKTELSGTDIGITFALLYGGIALDIIAFLMLIFSDWIAAAITKSEDPSCLIIFLRKVLFLDRQRWIRLRLILPVLSRRWSTSISQYNLIQYCLHPRPEWWEKFIGFFGLTDALDGLKYVEKKPFTEGLRDFIFEELRLKSEMADDLDTAKEICSAKGDWVLQIEGCNMDPFLPYTVQADYDESLVLWHIATELCYNDDKGNAANKDFREFSKRLSDYMLYLIIMNPKLMSAVAGIGEIRFRDTCAEAKKFFRGRKIGNSQEEPQSCFCCRKSKQGQGKEKPQSCFCCRKSKQGQGKEKPQSSPDDKEHERACKSILGVSTDVKPVTVKGDRSKSVLFDACILAKELNQLGEENKWKIISKVWVELLSYAACHCRANAHAARLSEGGQLVTVVWLLMAHLGLGDQFQINEGHARAKLIVEK